MLHAALASIPALLLVTVPKFALDFARFGPQEPLLIGGMALGGSLLVLAARPCSTARARSASSRSLRSSSPAALPGRSASYQKEISICVLPLLAGVAWAGRRSCGPGAGLSRARRLLWAP